MKSAIITGITGQDGAYLAELLLSKGYLVFGIYRRSGKQDFWRIEELGIGAHSNLTLVQFEASDVGACRELILSTAASEIYNLGGQSSAVASMAEPVATAHANGMTVLYWLEAIRTASATTKFFQAGSSEVFGQARQIPQVESTLMHPTSPYGVAKVFAHWATVNYRETFGVFAATAILFNHESPLRGMEFVTRKITSAFAKIKVGEQDVIELGNMAAERDWGYAKDYIMGMWMALQAEKPETYVFATNEIHTVRDFVTLAGKAAGFELTWEGEEEMEIGRDLRSGRILVRVNPHFYRPIEIHQRRGDPEKARTLLGWRPTTPIAQLCEIMVEADVRRLSRNT